ncbi:MAG: PAS domain S-box protein [Marinilabilia sp.]
MTEDLTYEELKQRVSELEQQNEFLQSEATIYRTLFDLFPHGISVTDSQGNIVEANSISEQLLGISKEEHKKRDIDGQEWRIIRKDCSDMPPDEWASVIALKEKRMVTGSEMGIVKPDAQTTWINVTAAPLPIEGYGVVITYNDITKNKQTENALDFERNQLLSIFDSLPAVINILDPETHEILFMNKYTRDLLGKNGVGMKCYQVFHNYTDKCYLCNNNDLLEMNDESIIRWEYYSKSFDRHFMTTNRLLKWPDGRKVKLEMSIDISDRLKMKKNLKESEEKYRKLIDTIPYGIGEVDLDGKMIFLNDSYYKILGYDSGDLDESYIWDHDPTSADIQQLKDYFEFLKAEQPEPEPYISQNIRKDGAIIDVHVDWDYVYDEQGALTGFISVVTDITERKKAEEEREKLQTQLNQAQKMESVGRLAGGVAHDFNNMLSVILGNTAMAFEEVDQSHPLHDELLEVQKAAKRSTNVVRQLLAFARKQTIAPRVLDLNEVVEDMLKMLRRLIGEDIDLSWQPGRDIWPVKMDPAQIDQILANLSVNARDAIDGVGRLTIETGKVSFDEAYCAEHPGFVPGDFVLLAVSDNGCGMDEETQKNLFEPFFTTKEVGKGTGLGLATVYGIVKQNNGFINVYSEPSYGTTFRIYLPRHRPVDTPARSEYADASDILGNETILLVEDEPTILKMTRIMLERLGYNVLIAVRPEEALNVAHEYDHEIHMLMTDVVMPEMNGWDLASKLLSLYPNLKWLFMSGYTEDVIAHHGVLDEGVNFIQKPFSKKDLAVIVRKTLDAET